MSSGLLRVLVVGLVLLAAASMLIPRRAIPPPVAATELPRAIELPQITFVDHRGDIFTSSDLDGSFSLLFFGFTNCPDICPLSMQVLADAKKWLHENTSIAAPRIVLISVDPDRDTPNKMREYLEFFDSDFLGLTAAEEKLAPLLSVLGVSVMKQNLGQDQYTVTHNPQVFVSNQSGDVIAIMSSAENAETVATDFVRIRTRHLRGIGPAAAPTRSAPLSR